MKHLCQDSRRTLLKSSQSQGDLLQQCTTPLGNNNSAFKYVSQRQIGGQAYFLSGDDTPTAAMCMDRSLTRGNEKSGSTMRKSHSILARPELPLLPNRTDSIASISSLSPLGTAIPMTPTPVASKYDLRMYPQIMEYARIVHWSQREKQKAQARGENVQKWKLPQIPTYQSVSTSSGQVVSTDVIDSQVGFVSQQNCGAAARRGVRSMQQMHQYNSSASNQQCFTNFLLPTRDQSKHDFSLSPSAPCLLTPLGGAKTTAAQPGASNDLPILLRNARLSPCLKNPYSNYSTKQSTINDQAAPLLHLGHSSNVGNAQNAAVALRLYLQAEQQRRQGIAYDNLSYNHAAATPERPFSHYQLNSSLKPSLIEQPQFTETKSSMYVDEDLETLSPCSSTGEIATSLVPFFNSLDLPGYNPSEQIQDPQLHGSNIVDNALPVYFQIPSTPAGTPECNPASPPTHLAATNACAVSPNVGSYYQHASSSAALAGRGQNNRIGTNDRYMSYLGCENYSQLNSRNPITSQTITGDPQNQVPLAVGWKDGGSKYNRVLSNCIMGARGQQQTSELSSSSNYLPAVPEKGNVQQILDQLYCSKGAAAQEIMSQVSPALYINPVCEKASSSPMHNSHYKQLNVSNTSHPATKLSAASVHADQVGLRYSSSSPRLADKLQGANTGVACLDNGNPNIQTVKNHGSLLHPNDCKPCAFFWTKGCQNGKSCKFCHEWHAPKKKKPMKDQRNLMIIARPDGKIEYIRCSLSEALVACNVY